MCLVRREKVSFNKRRGADLLAEAAADGVSIGDLMLIFFRETQTEKVFPQSIRELVKILNQNKAMQVSAASFLVLNLA